MVSLVSHNGVKLLGRQQRKRRVGEIDSRTQQAPTERLGSGVEEGQRPRGPDGRRAQHGEAREELTARAYLANGRSHRKHEHGEGQAAEGEHEHRRQRQPRNDEALAGAQQGRSCGRAQTHRTREDAYREQRGGDAEHADRSVKAIDVAGLTHGARAA